MKGPISPEAVQDEKDKGIPEVVFKVFNALITEKWTGNSATILQDTAVSRITSILGITRQEAFDRGYLDIESAYRKAGWKVEYDKPGYNENYEANFTFRKK